MLLFYLSLSIGVSFLCSLFEAVILSITPAYAATRKDSGKKSGILLERLKSNIDDSLAAILTLNTVAHTIGAAGVGAEVLKQFGDEYVAIGSVILTLLILVLSEIIPKTLGATYYRQFSAFAAYGIQVFIWITYPFVKIFKQLARLLGSPEHAHGVVTRDELLHSALIGQQAGKLSEDELKIIRNLLKFRKIVVSAVMTPRTVVFALQENLTIEEVFLQNDKLSFTRIPVFGRDNDDITGIVNRYDIVDMQAKGEVLKELREVKAPIHSISNKTTLGEAYEAFKKRDDHIFIVIDEHGGFDGVLTLEDVIETLLGIEITDEFDDVADMRAYAADVWKQKKEDALE